EPNGNRWRIGTKITEVVLSLRILGNSLPILRKRRHSCMTVNHKNETANKHTLRYSTISLLAVEGENLSKQFNITSMFRFDSALSLNSLLKRNNLLMEFTKDFNVLTEMPAW
ncbi:hypothetical protein L9F63_018985, partial [Diploptera punctata]